MRKYKNETYPCDASDIVVEMIHAMRKQNYDKAMALRDKYQRLHFDNPDKAWKYNPLEVEKIISIIEREYFIRRGN